MLSLLLCLCLSLAWSTPLDDYIEKDDGMFSWVDTEEQFQTDLGHTAYVLNVTSQRWLDISRAAGPQGDIWSHQVIVVVPKNIREKALAFAYLSGGSNEEPVKVKTQEKDLRIVDAEVQLTGAIGVVAYQLPNGPIVYPSDPEQKERKGDAMIAWAWNQFLLDQDPEWLPRFAMTKAAFKCMKAVEEFTQKQSIGSIERWAVAGASKQGWTAWMVGAATCASCVEIAAIIPMVPIVPNLRAEMHRMWQSYGGWTFFFEDYVASGLTKQIDHPNMTKLIELVDPVSFGERLSRLPKLVILASEDEFMMMDWSNIWYDDITGEKHLYIVQNAEHTLIGGLDEVIPSLATFINAVAKGKPRPEFDYTYDDSTGRLAVQIAENSTKPKIVRVWTGQTTQKTRQDFRWIRLADDDTEPCTEPDVPLLKRLCVQPIGWTSVDLSPPDYAYTPPVDTPPFTGYWIELQFPGATGLKLTNFKFTTPGFVWPSELPFPDCHDEECEGTLL